MLIEISMIQRFALLLGFPTLSLSVSLFTLLIATAVGARLLGVVRRWPGGGLPVVTATLIVLAAVYMLRRDAVTDAALSWPQWARIALVFVLLFPIGLLLGMFLPTGMDGGRCGHRRARPATAAGSSRGPGPSTASSPCSARR